MAEQPNCVTMTEQQRPPSSLPVSSPKPPSLSSSMPADGTKYYATMPAAQALPPPPQPPQGHHQSHHPIIMQQMHPMHAPPQQGIPIQIIPQHPTFMRHPFQHHHHHHMSGGNGDHQAVYPVHPQHANPALFNAKYASGITHIPVTHVHGLPPNMVLTPLHGAPPPGAPIHLIDTRAAPNCNFSVPPVQTVYTAPVNRGYSTTPQPPPGAVHNGHALRNLRERDLLPFNVHNHLYANSQPMSMANPHMMPPHVRNTLVQQQLENDQQHTAAAAAAAVAVSSNSDDAKTNAEKRHDKEEEDSGDTDTNTHNDGDVDMDDSSAGAAAVAAARAPSQVLIAPIPVLQALNTPRSTNFAYHEQQQQAKRIQAWNDKKTKSEATLKAIAAEHGEHVDSSDTQSSVGIPRTVSSHQQHPQHEHGTGRAHFVPSNSQSSSSTNDDSSSQVREYTHIGYNPTRHAVHDRKRKREEHNHSHSNSNSKSEENVSEVEYTETDSDDYDMDRLYDDDDDSSDDDDNAGEPPSKKRKRSSATTNTSTGHAAGGGAHGHGRSRSKTLSKTERKKLYEQYMRQFEGIEKQLDELKPIEPAEELKRTRKEYMDAVEVERILHRREFENPDTGMQKYEYYVLYKHLSYLHCEWVSEEQLMSEKKGAQKIKRFGKQANPDWTEGVELFDESYTTVDRILSARPGPGYYSGDTRFEYFVKFNALNYAECRWEFADDIDDDLAIQQFQRRSLMRSDCWEPKTRPKAHAYKPLNESENRFKDDNQLHAWQMEGVNWLAYNWYHRRGGILSDEMGLGKTVQVVATLQRISRLYARGPFLIVAPLSTINHWKREIETWTDLNVVLYQGTKEDRRICHFFEFRYFDNTGRRLIHADLYKFNILLATYESVMLDDELQRIKWKVCVVDEAHRLKNNEAKLSRHLRKCSMEHTILLTGTPIQNNMRELWNLLNFVDAASFATYKEFESRFGEEKMQNMQNNVAQIQALKQVIKPYFLRRLKEDVAKFIPEKKETIIEVELTRIQKQYYRALLEKNRPFLYRGVSARNAPKLMNIANDLRKICNHPYLINGAYERITNELECMDDKVDTMIQSSGKFILLNKLLPKLFASQNKVLVFSQWRITLDWIEEYMRRKLYPFERIDGNITGNNRQAAIDRFCHPNANAFIFLLTTKAGGVGLNLTAADTVIIFDSDWNPQNDIQAMARCHRIGQEKAVKVYRLITSRSYEKEMFLKASKKLGLGQAIMGGTMAADSSAVDEDVSQSATGGLTQIEINQLLKYGAYHVFHDDDKEADQFCEEDIEEILAKRATDVVFDRKNTKHVGAGDTFGSAFSRATFIASDDAADIDKDFWEKILPKELTPAEMIAALENSNAQAHDADDNHNTEAGADAAAPTAQWTTDNHKKEEFWTHLTRQVEEVRDLRERGMIDTQIQTVIKLLTLVANKPDIFSTEQRVKAQDWANYIENPRRFKRNHQHNKKVNEDEMFLPSSRHNRVAKVKQTVYKTSQFTPKEIESLTRLFFDKFGTVADNIFDIVHAEFCKSDGYTMPRSMREIAGWCNAFVLYLSTELHDPRDKNAFVDVKHVIKKLMPKDFKDLNSCNPDSDGDADNVDDDEDFTLHAQSSTTTSLPTSGSGGKKKKRKRQKKLPKNCQITDFPSLEEKWFVRLVNKFATTWAKRMRLAVLLRQRLKSVKNIAAIKIPLHVGGHKPVSWWTPSDDKNLVIGAAAHGVGLWDTIRKDATLGFLQRVLSQEQPDSLCEVQFQTHSQTQSEAEGNIARKCCGRNVQTPMDIQCDSCGDFLHGECCNISVDDIPANWYCFECCGHWPKQHVLYDRLAAILHAMKKTRYHGQSNKKSKKSKDKESRDSLADLKDDSESVKADREATMDADDDVNDAESKKADGAGDDDNNLLKVPKSQRVKLHPEAKKSVKEKLANSRTRIGRMWNFSLKEMHALQRTVQIFGQIAWSELKKKSKSPKTEEQVASYFFSFMSNVEYLIRCERLKELIVGGKIQMPLELQQKFCKDVNAATTATTTADMVMGMGMSADMDLPPPPIAPDLPPEVPPAAAVVVPGVPTVSGMSSTPLFRNVMDPAPASASSIPPPDVSNVKRKPKVKVKKEKAQVVLKLPDLIKGEILTMLDVLFSDSMVSQHFASFSSGEATRDGVITLDQVYSDILGDKYSEPTRVFDDMERMTQQKLSSPSGAGSDAKITQCIENIRMVVQDKKPAILAHFAEESEKQRILKHEEDSAYMPPAPAMDAVDDDDDDEDEDDDMLMTTTTNTNTMDMTTASLTPMPNYNRSRIKKTDLDMLSEADVEKYFGIKKPDSIVNHQLTVNLANKVWHRAQMWAHLRKVQDIDQATITKLYGVVKAQRNEPGTSSKLPEWWHPPKHDALVVALILKHGMQQTSEKMLKDALFAREVDVQEHKSFLSKFFIPKKPLILRLRYVAYVLTHGGEEPSRDAWHYNSLHELNAPFYYKPIQSREDYQRDMNEWFEQHEIQSCDQSQSPTPSSSIQLGLLSAKSPRRTGKSSELIDRYRTLPRDEHGDLIFPIQAKQGASIISLGKVVWDRKLFSSSKYIWPNGFESQRIHPSYLEPSQRVIYTSKIIDAGDRPKFAVIASDDPDNPIIANSASTAWTHVITKVNYAKDPDKRRKTCTVSGPEMFGYNDPLIIALIEELPESRQVINYWKNRTPFKEVLQDAMAQDI